MPPKKEYWTTITDEDHFMKFFNVDNKKLVGNKLII
jgi:hypothetical protein